MKKVISIILMVLMMLVISFVLSGCQNNTKQKAVNNDVDKSRTDEINVDKLLDFIYQETSPYMIELTLNIPYKDQKICHLIEEKATIYEKLYLEECTHYHISIDKKYYKELALYEEDGFIN